MKFIGPQARKSTHVCGRKICLWKMKETVQGKGTSGKTIEVTTPITSNAEDPENKDYGELCPLKQGY